MVTNEFHSAEMIEHSGTGNAVNAEQDFRLLLKEEEGEPIRRYVELMEKVNEHDTELLIKQKKKNVVKSA